MDITFAPATRQDIDTLYQLNKELIDRYEDTSCIDYDKVLTWVRRKITDNIPSYTCVYLCGRKAGFFRFVPNGDMMELDDLYIFPEYRQRGIGTRIIEKCCSSTDLPVMLYVFTKNTGALALYQRLGFRISRNAGNTRCIMVRWPHTQEEL